MSARRRLIGRLTAALLVIVLPFGLGAMVGTAHAKSLGTMTSQSLLGKLSPTDGITDTFNDAANTSLATTTDVYGDAWTVGPGAFKIVTSGSQLVVRATTTASSEATVPGTVDASVGGDLHTSTTSSFGLVLNAIGTTNYIATLLLYDRAARTLTLERLSATGVVTVWKTYSVPSATPLANSYLRFSYLDGVYTAYVNGTSVLTYTLTAPQQTEVEGYSRVGFGTVSDATSTFDNIQVYPL